ncbi:MAG: hypothetical protein Tsb009_38950 [Planctomycetaceae bacterium]
MRYSSTLLTLTAILTAQISLGAPLEDEPRPKTEPAPPADIQPQDPLPPLGIDATYSPPAPRRSPVPNPYIVRVKKLFTAKDATPPSAPAVTPLPVYPSPKPEAVSPVPVPSAPAHIPIPETKRIAVTFRLKHISAKAAFEKLKSDIRKIGALASDHKVSALFKQVKVAPYEKTNSCVVYAPQKVMGEIQKLISRLDKPSQQIMLRFKVTQTDSNGKTKTIAEPTMIVMEGIPAYIVQSSPEKTLKIEVTAQRVHHHSAHRHLSIKPWRKIPTPFSLPKPHVVKVLPSTVSSGLAISTGAAIGSVPNPVPIPQVYARPSARTLFSPRKYPDLTPYHSVGQKVRLTSGQLKAAPRSTKKVTIKTYPIADLLVPRKGYSKESIENNIQTILEYVKKSVRPHSWNESGETCQVFCLKSTLTLVVRQTEAGHRQTAELLQELRRLQATQKPEK